MSQIQAKVITLTGGGGRIAYSLIPMLCDGSIFGPYQQIHLKLLEVPIAIARLQVYIEE